MKKKIYKACEEIINVFWIYVLLMGILWSAAITRAVPELGVGALVIAVMINSGFKKHEKGGSDDGSD